MEGHGIYTWSNGKKYENEWKDGKKNGEGMMFFKDGECYDGKVKTDACIINGGMVRSTVRFNGQYYKSRDQGWRDDKVVWGSDEIYDLQKQ